MRRLAVLLILLVPAWSPAQYGVGAYYPSGPYLGFWTGPAFGYYPGAYRGFYSNGYSLYGPPVPTYGSVPGYFGGADQRLSNFPDLRYDNWYGPWGYRGGYIPLTRPKPVFVYMPGPALCEIHLPAHDAELYVNGTKIEGTGVVRQIPVDLSARLGTTWELEARWSTPESIGSGKRAATLRAGETTIVDFTSGEGAATLPAPRRLPIETIPAPARRLP